MNYKKAQVVLILCVSIMFIGCIGTNGKHSPTSSSLLSTSTILTITEYQPAITPSFTLNPTDNYVHSFPNPSTPHPTMEEEDQSKLLGLLKSNSCNLPCYLGIYPGTTTWEEAKTIFESLNAYFSYNTNIGDHTIYNLHLDIGDESLAKLTPDLNSVTTDVKIIQNLHLIVNDGIVQKMWTSISTRRSISKFQGYWSRYTLRQIFLQFGIPDQLLTGKRDAGGIGYGLFAVYEKEGLVFSVSGSAQDGYICPESENLSIGLEFSITNPASGLDLYAPPFTVLPAGRVYVPVNEVFGVTKEGFYTQLITDSQACFEVISK